MQYANINIILINELFSGKEQEIKAIWDRLGNHRRIMSEYLTFEGVLGNYSALMDWETGQLPNHTCIDLNAIIKTGQTDIANLL